MGIEHKNKLATKGAGITVFLAVILGIALRAYNLTGRSLWFDEAFSWRLIQFPFSEMIQRAATDVHPVFYYVLLKWWAFVFGPGILSLRSFSVVCAGLTVVALYGFVSYAFQSKRAGALASMLFAVSGWQIAFAWEARMYTLGGLLLVLSSWALLYALREKDKGVWPWITYAIVTALVLHTHYYGIFSVVAQGLFILGAIIVEARGRIGEIIHSKATWHAVGALVLTGLLFAPWVPTFLKQNAQVQNKYWIPPIGGWSIPDTFVRMVAPTSGIPSHQGIGIVTSALPMFLLIVGSIFFALSCNRKSFVSGKSQTVACDAVWLVLLSAYIPFLLSISLSFIGQSLYNDRFFVFANIFILIGVAVAIAGASWVPLRRTLVACCVLGLLWTNASYGKELDIAHRPGARGASEYILANRASKEPVVVGSPFVYFSVLH